MEILYLLVPLSVVLVFFILAGLWWAIDRGQFEDIESEGERILEEAMQRFAITNAACVHRTGELKIGDLAVWVGVSAGHRGPAFDACRWIIDEVKSRVPIWKRERYATGATDWLHPHP